MIRNILKNFATVPQHILYLIGAVFCIQLIDASSFILLNYYLQDLGYDDTAIANLTAFRYAAIVLFAFPFGLFIKGRTLTNFFRIAAVATPSCMLLILFALHKGFDTRVLYALMFLMGTTVIFMKVTALPFIILNTPKNRHSEAIALFFQTFSLTAFMAGVSNYICSSINPSFFTEGTMLVIFGLTGYLALFFTLRINIEEKISERIPMKTFLKAYDWKRILLACFPTLLIATGAGLTIPFLNLFFMNVHAVDSSDYSLYSSMSFVVVAVMMMFAPYIRRAFGYNVIINGFQLLAIFALFVMASTEWYADWRWAGAVAIVAFLLRQPLMHISSPASSELIMYYVGERNQEMIGALNASIWSGSWFFSSVIFGILRAQQVSYVNIFMMTVVMYLFATLVYYFLIKDYEKKKKVTIKHPSVSKEPQLEKAK